MPEAVSTDLVFTISLKRSTQNLQLSTSSPADYPIFKATRVIPVRAESSRVRARAKLFLGRDVTDSTQRDPRAERPAGATSF